jgi:translocator assembly and maintenance protein 41
VKYGVIQKDRLIQDLSGWNALYVAGRMHKPVKVLVDDNDVRAAQLQNISHAYLAALLLLPEHFTDEDLWRAITAISYEGDVRMGMCLVPISSLSHMIVHASHLLHQ